MIPVDALLVDGQRLFREGLKAILRGCPEIRVVEEANSGLEALEYVRKHRPPLMLTGLRFSDLSGVDLIIQAVKSSPGTRVVVISAMQDEQSVIAAVRAGAKGYLLKTCGADELFACVVSATQGASYLCGPIRDMLADKCDNNNLDPKPMKSKLELLNHQELQVFRLAAEGYQNKEIAVIMHLTPHTVRSYRKTMMKKLGISSVARLTMLAAESGMITKLVASDEIQA